MTRGAAVLVAVVSASTAAPADGGAAGARRGQPDPPVTYAGDIAPLLNRHCVSCHRPRGVAPFSLTSYTDVAARADLIAAVTERREMPPWQPVPGFGEFRNERRLAPAAIDLIRRWADAGAPRGVPGGAPAVPMSPDAWSLGTPDLVVTMADAYPLPAEGEDVYRNFVLPVPIDTPRFVRAVELEPATTRGIHHARIEIDRTRSARRLDAADASPGYDPMHADEAGPPDGHFLGWAPGSVTSALPEGLAWRLDPGTDLVLELHLVPRRVPERVQVAVGLFFTDTPPSRTPVLVQLGSRTIDIPAGARAHEVEDEYRLPVDVDVLSIYPHAHFLATAISCVATLPDGTVRWLIRIDDWDFNWQDAYRYRVPVRLPRGTMIRARYVYDNSAANPRNPTRPPQRVRFGHRSTDEMAELTLQVLPVEPADRPALAAHAGRKALQIVVAGAERRVADAPGVPGHHEDLAVALVAVGRVDEAVAHLREAIRLDPARAAAHYKLGTALVVNGDREAAMASYERAVALQPDFAEAHNNLGGLFDLRGDYAAAARHYRRTLELDPAHPGAHFNLGNLLLEEARFQDAERAFRRTLAVRPDRAEALAGLGAALDGQGHLEDAIDAYRGAIRLDPTHAPIHQALGVLLQRLGRLAAADAAFAEARRLGPRPR